MTRERGPGVPVDLLPVGRSLHACLRQYSSYPGDRGVQGGFAADAA